MPIGQGLGALKQNGINVRKRNSTVSDVSPIARLPYAPTRIRFAHLHIFSLDHCLSPHGEGHAGCLELQSSHASDGMSGEDGTGRWRPETLQILVPMIESLRPSRMRRCGHQGMT